MTAKEFQRLVTRDESEFLDRFLALLAERKIDYCVIGGLAVNAYAEPLVTLDCDVIVVTARVPELEELLRPLCKIERFPHSLNLTSAGSDVRIQIQTDDEIQDCLSRRRKATVLGRAMFVAAPEDLIVLKVAAYREPKRRRSKREKDRVDIIRLVESLPHLKDKLPADIQAEFKL